MLIKYHNRRVLVVEKTNWTHPLRRNAYIGLLREFLIVLCVLCVPQVDGSLYQIKHCLGLCYMSNIALK